MFRSEVFAAMLRHEFLEKQNSRVDVKVLTSITTNILGIHSFINIKLTMNDQCNGISPKRFIDIS